MLKRTIEKGAEQRGFDRGKSEGFASGKSEGIEQGINQRNLEIANNLLKQNVDINIISMATGLTIEEIKALK